MDLATADLCDAHAARLQVAEPIFRSFGARRAFSGTIQTLGLFEDNGLVRTALGQDGTGKVLVIDGGGSLRCALVGDKLAALAVANGWAGIVVFGCIRDSEAIQTMNLGVRALATHPMRTEKRGQGQAGLTVRFAGVTFAPGHWLCADADGIVVASSPLV